VLLSEMWCGRRAGFCGQSPAAAIGGWGGFTTQDLKRCRLLAASVALIHNWWSLFVWLADPDQHREVITSRPLREAALERALAERGWCQWAPKFPQKWASKIPCYGGCLADQRSAPGLIVGRF
jgi:hypothetical protein